MYSAIFWAQGIVREHGDLGHCAGWPLSCLVLGDPCVVSVVGSNPPESGPFKDHSPLRIRTTLPYYLHCTLPHKEHGSQSLLKHQAM